MGSDRAVFGSTTVEQLVARAVPPLDGWLVVSFVVSGGGKWWKVHPGIYTTREAAEQHAQQQTDAHIAYAVLRVQTPLPLLGAPVAPGSEAQS